MSIMKKIFSFGNNKLRKSRVITKRFQPQLEPLEDRHLLSVSSLLTSAVPGTLNQTDPYAEMQLQIGTQTGGNSVVGIRIDATTAGFDPSAISIYNENNVKISGSAIKYLNADYSSSSSSSLLLVELAPGNYTIRVGGDKATYGSFVCDVFLPGDSNHDHTVSNTELRLSDAAVLASQGLLNNVTLEAWQRMGYSKADILAVGNDIDINRDGKISGVEIDTVATNSVAGKVTATIISDNTGPEITAQLVEDNGVSNSDKITSDPTVKGTITDESGFDLFQASFNGTDWFDVLTTDGGAFTLTNDALKGKAGSPVAADGTIVNGQYTLNFKAVDLYGNISNSTFNYTVIATNTPPTTGTGNFNTGEKVKLEDTLVGLYSDADAGDVAKITAETINSKEGISVTINADGTFSYDPGDHFASLNVGNTMVDEFEYTVTDAMGATTKGTVKITINPVNDAPVAADLLETTNQDTNKTIDVIAAATDVDNDNAELSIVSVTQPQTSGGTPMGEVKIENGKLVFYPNNDFKALHEGESETVTFSYTIKDPGGLTSEKTITMTVNGLYDAPKAENDTAAVNADGSAIEINVLANDTIVDHGAAVELVNIATQPTKGIATVENGKVKFDPNGAFNHLGQGVTEEVTLTYTVKNSLDASKTSTGTVTVTVTGVNSLPVISGPYDFAITEKETKEISVDDLLALASDENGDTLTISEVKTTTPGVNVKIDNGKVIYNPGSIFHYLGEGETATDSFTFIVSDGKGGLATGTVNVTITGVNDLLTVVDQTVTVTSTGTVDPAPSTAIVVTDPDKNDSYKFEIVGTPTGGPGGTLPTITIDENTGVIYVSKTNMPGKTEVGEEYTIEVKVTNVNDPTDFDTAIIKIKVVENQPPVAVDVTVDNVGEKDATATIKKIEGVTDLEGNDFVFLSALTNATFTIDGLTQTVPTGYIATLTEDGTFSFNPNGKFDLIPAGKTGVLTLTYQVQDTDFGGIGTAKITINIVGANDAPVALDTSNSTSKDATVAIDPAYTDVDLNDTATTEIVSQPDKGSVTVNSSGQMVFNPNGAFNGLNVGQQEVVTFTYCVKDASGAYSEEKTVKVTVTGKNLAHTVPTQIMTVTSNNPAANITVGKVNVTDVDGPRGSYSYSITNVDVDGPNFSIDSSGNITVTKAGLPETGTFVLTVKVSDSDHEATGTITVNVVTKQPPVTPPAPHEMTVGEDVTTAVVSDEITGITYDGAFVFDMTVTALTFTIDGTTYNTIPTGFIASVDAVTGKVSFNPNGKFDAIPQGKNGILTLQYTVRDPIYGVSATGTIKVTITGANDRPTAANITDATTDQNTDAKIDVLSKVTDPDFNDTHTIVSVGTIAATDGAITFTPTGNIIFTPGANCKALPKGETKDISFAYTIKDANGLESTGTVKITVTGTNDAPVAVNDNGGEILKNASTPVSVLTNDTDPDTGEAATLVVGWVGRDSQGKAIDLTTETGRRVDFTEGDYVIVSANGKTIVYYAGTRYKDNGKGTDATATFQYQAKDVQGDLSNKATVSVLVKGADDPPEFKALFENEYPAGAMGTYMDFDLNDYFSGTNLKFTFQKGSDPSQMLNVELISGHILRVHFTEEYSSSTGRNPVAITVTATLGDGTQAISQTFKASTQPTKTANVTVVVKGIGEESAVWKSDSVPTNSTDLEFAVGEEYYIEIWGTDFINQLDKLTGYSQGIQTFIVSLGFNGELVKVVDYEFYKFTFPGYTTALDDPSLNSQNAEFKGLGGTIFPATQSDYGIGIDGQYLLAARIKIQVKDIGNVNYTILDADENDPDVLTFARLRDFGTPDWVLSSEQVEIILPPTVSHVTTSTPLLGEETPEVVTEGGAYVRVVTEPTLVPANGYVTDIVDNANWIHEWQHHWAEIWIKASDVAYYLNGKCDLSYNTNYFTATAVELGPAFRGNSNVVIDDANGLISGIGGSATQIVTGDGYVLLGRVKFESIGSDNVPFSEASFAHDLGISLSNVKIESSTGKITSFVGKSPRTELWAVPYDANDNGKVQVDDFIQFVIAFTGSRASNEIYLSAFDYNNNGKVQVDDFIFFAMHYGYDLARDSGVPVYFPQSFTQRYVGKTLDADNAATVNKIIDAANKAWQDALGLDKPIDVQIVVKDLANVGDGNELANAQITAIDQNGLPLKGIIVLDDDGAGMGWYSQIAEPVANGRYDLYTTLLHEMGHIYGFNTNYDAFSEVVEQYLGQLDSTGMHASNSDDLMYATLATGVRKFISEFDVSIINSAYNAAQNDSSLGFSNAVSASTAALTAGSETQLQNSVASVEQTNGSFVTVVMFPTVTSVISPTRMVDDNTAAQLHAMGLAVSIPQNMLQKEEKNSISLTIEQIHGENQSLFDLSDDDLMSLHQPQDVDESEQALIDLSLDLDV